VYNIIIILYSVVRAGHDGRRRQRRRRRAHTHTTASLSRRPFNPRTAAVVDHPARRSYCSYVLLYTVAILLCAPLAKNIKKIKINQTIALHIDEFFLFFYFLYSTDDRDRTPVSVFPPPLT